MQVKRKFNNSQLNRRSLCSILFYIFLRASAGVISLFANRERRPDSRHPNLAACHWVDQRAKALLPCSISISWSCPNQIFVERKDEFESRMPGRLPHPCSLVCFQNLVQQNVLSLSLPSMAVHSASLCSRNDLNLASVTFPLRRSVVGKGLDRDAAGTVKK